MSTQGAHEGIQVHSRRRFLTECTYGTGLAALWHVLTPAGRAATAASVNDPKTPLAPHFSPRAKTVIFFFMAGAPSQVDLFDPKPRMKKWHGQPLPDSMQKDLVDPFKKIAPIMASPRQFSHYGECGMEFSELVPHIGSCADDICMIRSVYTDVTNHHPGQLLMNCGS